MARRLSDWLARVLAAETRTGVIIVVTALVSTFLTLDTGVAARVTDLLARSVAVAGHELTIHDAVADGLLAFFFLVVGIELRHELTIGSLRGARRAFVPVAAAIGGMAIPVGLFLAVTGTSGYSVGWGIPMATDIAIALAVLALVAPATKPELRAFLLALAVIDDLGAILVIAIVYSSGINLVALTLAVAHVAALIVVQRTWLGHPVVLVAISAGVWWWTFMSGVHPTIAGVAVGLVLSARGGDQSPAERALRAVHPISEYVAVPAFVFVSTAGLGTRILAITSGADSESLAAPVLVIAIIVGLVVGKPLGIVAATWVTTRWFGGALDPALRLRHIWLVGILGSIGFTVALLMVHLSFRPTDWVTDAFLAQGTLGVVAASLIGAALAALLGRRLAR